MLSRKAPHRVCAVRQQSGFTLVEIVVGIVVSAISLTFLTTLFFANPGRSVEPILHIRAVEFGQALMDEILSKSFDEFSPVGGVPACTATCSSTLGPETGEVRDNFDDVDDYNIYCGGSSDLIDSLGNSLSDSNIFTGYSMRVCVEYDDNFDGTVGDGNIQAKLITIEITPPLGAGLGDPIVLTAYRGNF